MTPVIDESVAGSRALVAGELRDVRPLLEPSSVAVVGASERNPAIVRNVLASPVRTVLVNPRRREIFGVPCSPSLSELDEAPEVAVLAVSHGQILEAAAEAIAIGCAGLVVPGLGAESGRAGPAIAAELRKLAEAADVAVLGPNCMGSVRPLGTSLWIGVVPPTLASGSVSVLAQSGSVAEGLAALGGRVGFRSIVSCGGELSRDVADFLGFWADEPETRAIGLFLETVRRPEALSAALVRCAEAGQPVACLKAGRSSAAHKVALAHTGALVGSARASSAFFRAHGVIEVDDLADLVEVLEVLGRRRWPAGGRLAAVSESGGEAELLADHAEAAGLELVELGTETVRALSEEFPNFVQPVNPLDAWAVDAPERVFPRSLQLLADSGDVDVLVAQVDLTQFRSDGDQIWCEGIVRALAGAVEGGEIFGAVVSSQLNDPSPQIARIAREADLPLLRGIGAATRALAAVASFRPRKPEPAPEGPVVEVADLLLPGVLPEYPSGELLERYGIAVAPRRLARGAVEASRAAEELGFPVVVKVHGPAHKSVLGGVQLGLQDAEEVAAATRRLAGEEGEVLVARQVGGGVELICGLERDPIFGVVVALGAGGPLAELPALSSVALAPISGAGARRLIGESPWIGRVLGAPLVEQLATVLESMSLAAFHHPEISAIDINPLVSDGTGLVALDALVIVEAAPPRAAPKAAPRPISTAKESR